MSVERKKLELSMKRVQLGIDELEFKIFERLEDVKRLEENIEKSKEALKELQQQLDKEV